MRERVVEAEGARAPQGTVAEVALLALRLGYNGPVDRIVCAAPLQEVGAAQASDGVGGTLVDHLSSRERRWRLRHYN